LAIVATFLVSIINIPDTIRENHFVKRDLAAYDAWVAAHGGRQHFGRPFPDEFGSVETHHRLDVVCFPHYSFGKHVDSKIYLLVNSHRARVKGPRVVDAVPGPLRPKPTATGPKCGHGPPAHGKYVPG
jgi:hypothetical protein